MLINEAGVVRAIKRAYKGGGYTVNVRGGVMSIYTESWYIQARREIMPRKVLAAIVEHAGMIPAKRNPPISPRIWIRSWSYRKLPPRK